MRRVVITGLGMVSPVGCGAEASWQALIAGANGARRITEFEVDDLTCQIGCFIPRGATAEGKFNPDDWMEPKEQRKVDDFIIYAMAAATQALANSGYAADTAEKQERTGVLIGSGIGGLSGIADTSLLLRDKGPRRVSPFFIPGRLINLASGYVSIKHQLKGPNHAVVTACSTGAHAIGDAARLVALGDADVMVAGGANPRSAASRSPVSPHAERSRPASTIGPRRRAELGLEPGAELRELERKILGHDPALAAPTSAGRAAGHRVPPPPTPTIGRCAELRALRALLLDPRTRLVSLVGPAGIGKTRLAVELASELGDELADGALLVDLAPLSEPAQVVPALGRALGLREESPGAGARRSAPRSPVVSCWSFSTTSSTSWRRRRVRADRRRRAAGDAARGTRPTTCLRLSAGSSTFARSNRRRSRAACESRRRLGRRRRRGLRALR